MKIGVSAFAWTARFQPSHLNLLPKLKQMGVAGLEVPMLDPHVLPVVEIRSAFEANEVECTVCALLPKHINPISPDKSDRNTAVKYLTECIETSAEMGAKTLGGPLFAPIGYLPQHRPTETEFSWAVEVFQALDSALDQNDMTLSIEPVNRSETFFLRTAADAKRLCDSVGNLRIGITIDTFHANIEELSIPQAIKDLGPRLKHVHLSENDRGPLGRGHIAFDEILTALTKIEFHGYLMIEGFGYDKNETDAPGTLWADVAVSPDSFVEESVGFLKKLMQRA
jgi:D-psicose/D-tagatose/L-ribulose 3-epimerase